MAQGIWQDTDHRPVNATEAHREWTLRATEILVEIAGRYGRSINYGDLAGEVQRRTGIHTDMATETWLDDVLSEVTKRCVEAGKPALTALVDDAGVPANAAARSACYAAYDAKPPRAKGGRPSRARKPRTHDEPRPRRTTSVQDRKRPVCPTCFVEVPA
ncbi:MAG: hypothetical protein Q4F67_07390, partial [Propionibacteriaceae bacterium]|nr:hypothetical protein [Propionibacteriaceae bacterium]